MYFIKNHHKIEHAQKLRIKKTERYFELLTSRFEIKPHFWILQKKI